MQGIVYFSKQDATEQGPRPRKKSSFFSKDKKLNVSLDILLLNRHLGPLNVAISYGSQVVLRSLPM